MAFREKHATGVRRKDTYQRQVPGWVWTLTDRYTRQSICNCETPKFTC